MRKAVGMCFIIYTRCRGEFLVRCDRFGRSQHTCRPGAPSSICLFGHEQIQASSEIARTERHCCVMSCGKHVSIPGTDSRTVEGPSMPAQLSSGSTLSLNCRYGPLQPRPRVRSRQSEAHSEAGQGLARRTLGSGPATMGHQAVGPAVPENPRPGNADVIPKCL